MTRILALMALLATFPALAADPQPGYGKVESLTRLAPRPPAEPSASAGASSQPSPSKAPAPRWLVRVRMDDGSVQVREMKRPSVAVGSRVLLTNAGDVLPD